MINFDYEMTVTRFGYREKRVTNRFFDFAYVSGDSIDKFKKELAARTKGGPDNHECYVLTKPDGSKIAVQFSDWHMYVGLDIRDR